MRDSENMIKGKLQHIAILTADLDKARIFYGKILALRELERPPFFIPGAWYDLGEFSLHVMCYENMKKIDSHPECDTIYPHFALTMEQEEIELLLNRLKKNKTQIIEEKTNGTLQYFFYDFDGNMIEINREFNSG